MGVAGDIVVVPGRRVFADVDELGGSGSGEIVALIGYAGKGAVLPVQGKSPLTSNFCCGLVWVRLWLKLLVGALGLAAFAAGQMVLFASIFTATGSHRFMGIWYAVQDGVVALPAPSSRRCHRAA